MSSPVPGPPAAPPPPPPSQGFSGSFARKPQVSELGDGELFQWEDRYVNKQDMIFRLEKELGATVKALETARERQQTQVSGLRNQLATASKERDEYELLLRTAKTNSETLQTRCKALQSELESQMKRWAEERQHLERRLASAEASMAAAQESEREIIQHAANLDHRLEQAQVEERRAKELQRTNEQLESRCKQQVDQINQLRAKLENVTNNLNSITHSKGKERTTVSSVACELAEIKYEKAELEKLLEQKDREVALERKEKERAVERIDSMQESMQSALHLSSTREKQIAMLQQALESEQAQSHQAREAHHKELLSLQRKIQELYLQAQQREQKLQNQLDSSQAQLQTEREKLFRLNNSVATPAKTDEDAEKPFNNAISRIQSDQIEFSSPATRMIREFLAVQSKGETLDSSRLLEISERHARAAIPYGNRVVDMVLSESVQDPEPETGGESLQIEMPPIPRAGSLQPKDMNSDASVGLIPSAELTKKYQRDSTPLPIKTRSKKKKKKLIKKKPTSNALKPTTSARARDPTAQQGTMGAARRKKENAPPKWRI